MRWNLERKWRFAWQNFLIRSFWCDRVYCKSESDFQLQQGPCLADLPMQISFHDEVVPDWFGEKQTGRCDSAMWAHVCWKSSDQTVNKTRSLATDKPIRSSCWAWQPKRGQGAGWAAHRAQKAQHDTNKNLDPVAQAVLADQSCTKEPWVPEGILERSWPFKPRRGLSGLSQRPPTQVLWVPKPRRVGAETVLHARCSHKTLARVQFPLCSTLPWACSSNQRRRQSSFTAFIRPDRDFEAPICSFGFWLRFWPAHLDCTKLKGKVPFVWEENRRTDCRCSQRRHRAHQISFGCWNLLGGKQFLLIS